MRQHGLSFYVAMMAWGSVFLSLWLVWCGALRFDSLTFGFFLVTALVSGFMNFSTSLAYSKAIAAAREKKA
jgi:hypothetical protein